MVHTTIQYEAHGQSNLCNANSFVSRNECHALPYCNVLVNFEHESKLPEWIFPHPDV